MKWSRRIYLLNGRRIDSSEVDGFLYTRRRDIETLCAGCNKPIIKGQKYVILNYYDYGDDPIHFDCYRKPCILGVRQYIDKWYGLDRGFVECVHFNGGQTE